MISVVYNFIEFVFSGDEYTETPLSYYTPVIVGLASFIGIILIQVMVVNKKKVK